MHEKLAIPEDISVGRGMVLRESLIRAHSTFVQNHNDNLTIVEIGVLRDERPAAQGGDGWSSILWAWYAKINPKAHVFLVDVSDESLTACKNMLNRTTGIPENVTVLKADGVEFLRTTDLGSSIDLLYLDGSDDPQEMHDQFQAADQRGLSTEGSVVLLDDIGPLARIGPHGKGSKLVPILNDNDDWVHGYDSIAKQMLYVRAKNG